MHGSGCTRLSSTACLLALLAACASDTSGPVAVTGPRAYVTSMDAFNGTTIVDLDRQRVAGRLPALQLAGRAVAAPDGRTAWFADGYQIMVLETAANRVASTIPLADAGDVDLSPDGTTLFVAGSASFRSAIFALDAASGIVLDTVQFTTVPFSGFDRALALAVAPDGRNLVVSLNGGYLANVSTASRSLTRWTNGSDNAADMATTPGRPYVYLATIGGGFSVVAPSTLATVASIPFGDDWTATSIAISPDGRHAYVTLVAVSKDGRPPVSRTGRVAVIDLDTHSQIRMIDVGEFPSDVAFSPDGTHAWVPNLNETILSVIDVRTHSVVRTLRLSIQPKHVLVVQ